jgi:uncharacterized protein
MTPKEIAEKNTIMRLLVGSEAYGLSDGPSSDRDEKGVCIEPLEAHIGFSRFEQYEYRSAAERTGIKDAKSEAGDLDLTIYSLKKFLSLALKGNPTIIEMLFLQTKLKGSTAVGGQLQDLYPYIVSRKAGGAYLGYMQAQRRKLLSKEPVEDSARFDLVQKFGYDTKFAMHLLRLGFQGAELLETGKLTLPVVGSLKTDLMNVRHGKCQLSEVLACADGLEDRMKKLLDDSPVQAQPNVDYVQDWMVNTYWNWWKGQRFHLDRLKLVQ